MYEQQHPADWNYINADSGSNILFISKRALLDKVLSPPPPITAPLQHCTASTHSFLHSMPHSPQVRPHLPAAIKHVLCFEDVAAAGGLAAFAAKTGLSGPDNC